MIRKTARNVAATVCLLIGIAGLFLPFIQGIAMIVLAVVIADFDAKERLLERYRHTRIGRHLWERHEARKAKDAARCLRMTRPPPRETDSTGEETQTGSCRTGGDAASPPPGGQER